MALHTIVKEKILNPKRTVNISNYVNFKTPKIHLKNYVLTKSEHRIKVIIFIIALICIILF